MGWKPKYKYVDQVIEFDSVDKLNEWLMQENVYRKIHKVYRNADLKYFIYYQAKFANA
jgi:hypothetical protein